MYDIMWRGVLRDRQAAEDVAAEAFLTAYEHIGQFDSSRSFISWFYRIVVNGALMVRRQARRHVNLGNGDAALANHFDTRLYT